MASKVTGDAIAPFARELTEAEISQEGHQPRPWRNRRARLDLVAFNADGVPSLTTTYPADKGVLADVRGFDVIVEPSLKGDERCEAIWVIARSIAKRAGDAAVPTPMQVDGNWYAEGAVGGAVVRVSGEELVRWLTPRGRPGPRAGLRLS